VYAPENLCVDNTVIFEEYPLACAGKVSDEILGAFAEMSDEPIWKDEIKTRLAIVSNEMFAYFAENACEIVNHNRIDDVSGVVAKGALFSQENVPSETMFYAVFNSRNADDFVALEDKLKNENNLLQIGADMTTGLGWCSVAMKEVK
jgi:CRISPR-associated protein Cmr4